MTLNPGKEIVKLRHSEPPVHTVLSVPQNKKKAIDFLMCNAPL